LLLAILLQKKREEVEGCGVASPKALFSTHYADCLTNYLDDCLDGSIYDRIVGLTDYSRDEVKSRFLAVIYGHPGDMRTKVGLAVEQLYPAVFAAVATLNRQLGHGGLPRLMQTMESGVMIGRVAARLLREHPLMPLLTVHDSVLVPEEYAANAQCVIAEEWVAEFGVEPRVKTSLFMEAQTARKTPKRKKRRRWGRRQGPCGTKFRGSNGPNPGPAFRD
jgi:hypothetical protein